MRYCSSKPNSAKIILMILCMGTIFGDAKITMFIVTYLIILAHINRDVIFYFIFMYIVFKLNVSFLKEDKNDLIFK